MYSTSRVPVGVNVCLEFADKEFSSYECSIPLNTITLIKKGDMLRIIPAGYSHYVIFEIYHVRKSSDAIKFHLAKQQLGLAWVFPTLRYQPEVGKCFILHQTQIFEEHQFISMPHRDEVFVCNEKQYSVHHTVWNIQADKICFPVLCTEPLTAEARLIAKSVSGKLLPTKIVKVEPGINSVHFEVPAAIPEEFEEIDSDSDSDSGVESSDSGSPSPEPGRTYGRSESFCSQASYATATATVVAAMRSASQVAPVVVDPQTPDRIQLLDAKRAKYLDSRWHACIDAYRGAFHFQPGQSKNISRGRTLQGMTAMQMAASKLPFGDFFSGLVGLCSMQIQEKYEKNDQAIIDDPHMPALPKMQAATHFNMQTKAGNVVQNYWYTFKHYKELWDLRHTYNIDSKSPKLPAISERDFRKKLLRSYVKWRARHRRAQAETAFLIEFASLMQKDLKIMQQEMLDTRRFINNTQIRMDVAAKQKRIPKKKTYPA